MIPKVSVVMPTRGRATYVKRAIASVLDQTWSKFELLILDNSASPDKESIREISVSDSRIRLVERGNTGVTEARRLGAEIATGKLFALLDSDDYWERDRLERHIEVWTHNRIGLSWDRWAEVGDGKMRMIPQPFSEGLIEPPKVALKLFKWNLIHASAGIVSVKFARMLGFPLLDIMSSDWVLFMRAAEYYPAYFIGDTLSFKETSSPARVTSTEPSDYFRTERLKIQRWALLHKPGTYGLSYLRTKIGLGKRMGRLTRKTGYAPGRIQEPVMQAL